MTSTSSAEPFPSIGILRRNSTPRCTKIRKLFPGRSNRIWAKNEIKAADKLGEWKGGGGWGWGRLNVSRSKKSSQKGSGWSAGRVEGVQWVRGGGKGRPKRSLMRYYASYRNCRCKLALLLVLFLTYPLRTQKSPPTAI